MKTSSWRKQRNNRTLVHYICYYNTLNSNRKILVQPSAITKIDYIKSVLKGIGCDVILYSLAEGDSAGKWSFYRQKKVTIDDSEEVLFISTWIRSNLFLKFFSRIWMWIQLLYYLLFRVHENDCVILYHSLAIKPVIVFLKKWLGVKRELIVEVEEIFSAVYKYDSKKIQKEIEYIQAISSKNIVVNELMMDKCGLHNDFAVCYGSYNIAARKKNQVLKTDDNKIHVVYAGVIGQKGTDAFLAVKIADALPQNYRIHILGYGTDVNIENLKRDIEIVNSKHKNVAVSYDGCLLGDDYIEFLQGCQLGLCTRTLEDEYSDYTFPSKVLVYLGNNVLPVCTPIRCIQHSQISKSVVFSNDASVDSIVNSILSISSFSVDNTNVLKKLHSKFADEMSKMVMNIAE